MTPGDGDRLAIVLELSRAREAGDPFAFQSSRRTTSPCVLGATGRRLGELPSVLLRYAWPETTTAAEQPSPRPEGGRVLVAWSAAGGSVPTATTLTDVGSTRVRVVRAGIPEFDDVGFATALREGQRGLTLAR
jgi:hypothetical protein